MIITHLLMSYEFHDRSAPNLANTLGITMRPKPDFLVEVSKRAALAVSGGGPRALRRSVRSAVAASGSSRG